MELIISNRSSVHAPLEVIEYCVPFREDRRRSSLKPFLWEDFHSGQAAATAKETSPLAMYGWSIERWLWRCCHGNALSVCYSDDGDEEDHDATGDVDRGIFLRGGVVLPEGTFLSRPTLRGDGDRREQRSVASEEHGAVGFCDVAMQLAAFSFDEAKIAQASSSQLASRGEDLSFEKEWVALRAGYGHLPSTRRRDEDPGEDDDQPSVTDTDVLLQVPKRLSSAAIRTGKNAVSGFRSY